MNDTQLLERLASAYATLEPPAPSAALAELFEADEVERDDVVVPFVRPRTRVRVRHLVAAAVATFVLFSGLAVAGALPDPVQRQVSSVASHLGIDLPSPESGSRDVRSDAPDGRDAPDRPHTTSSPSSGAPGAAGSSGAPASGSTPPGTPTTTVPVAGGLGDIGAVTGGATTATTVPPNADGLLPPVTVPGLPLPPVTVPQLPLPLPTLPPVTVPQLPLPLPFDLPIHGL